MNYGSSKRYTRTNVPVQVLTGFFPTEPVKLSSIAPVLDNQVSVIKSGMAIVKATGTIGSNTSAKGWQVAQPANAKLPQSVYIALHDADSHDVQASGMLVGLDCSDRFEIQTGYFDPAQVWILDMALAVGADGTLVAASAGAGSTPADFIIGRVSSIGAGKNNASTPIASGSITYNGLTSPASNSLALQFKTLQTGVVKTAAVTNAAWAAITAAAN